MSCTNPCFLSTSVLSIAEGSMGRPFFYVKCCSDIVGDNVAVREGVKKDKLMGNFPLVKDTLTT